MFLLWIFYLLFIQYVFLSCPTAGCVPGCLPPGIVLSSFPSFTLFLELHFFSYLFSLFSSHACLFSYLAIPYIVKIIFYISLPNIKKGKQRTFNLGAVFIIYLGLSRLQQCSVFSDNKWYVDSFKIFIQLSSSALCLQFQNLWRRGTWNFVSLRSDWSAKWVSGQTGLLQRSLVWGIKTKQRQKYLFKWENICHKSVYS